MTNFDSILSGFKEILNEIYLEFQSKIDNEESHKCLKEILEKYTPLVDTKVCTSAIKNGPRKGKPCGAKIKGDKEYCARHTPKTCKYLIEKKKCAKEICPFSKSFCKIHYVHEPRQDTKIVYKNKWGSLEHKPTSLVFVENKVCGKQTLDGSISKELTDEEFLCIKEYKFPVSPEIKELMINFLMKK